MTETKDEQRRTNEKLESMNPTTEDWLLPTAGMELTLRPLTAKMTIHTTLIARRTMKDATWKMMLSTRWTRLRGRIRNSVICGDHEGTKNETGRDAHQCSERTKNVPGEGTDAVWWKLIDYGH